MREFKLFKERTSCCATNGQFGFCESLLSLFGLPKHDFDIVCPNSRSQQRVIFKIAPNLSYRGTVCKGHPVLQVADDSRFREVSRGHNRHPVVSDIDLRVEARQVDQFKSWQPPAER